MKLKLRENQEGAQYRYYAYSDSGKKYSVINIGELMKTDPSYNDEQKEEWFNVWEAMELIDDKLDTENPIRAKTWQELEKLLDA